MESVKAVETTVGCISYCVSQHDGDRPTALLWPSLFSSGRSSWGPQLETLHALGFRTILIDPPGHGASSPSPATFTIGQCSDVALRILDAEGVAKAVFLGVSWGSFVAMKTGIAAPDRVAALVLSNTTSAPSSGFGLLRDKLSVGLIRLGVPGGRGRLIIPALLGARAMAADPAFAKSFAAEVDRIDKFALARAAQSVLVDREDMTGDLPKIRAPTMVIAGIHDSVFPPKLGESVAAAIPAARFEVIDGAHLAPRGDAAAISALLRSFLLPLRETVTVSSRGPA